MNKGRTSSSSNSIKASKNNTKSPAKKKPSKDLLNNPQVQRTRANILRTTRHILAESGYREITIDAISERSRSSRSTIYRYWPTLSDLLFDAFEELVGKPFESPNSGDFKKDLLHIHLEYAKAVRNADWINIIPSFIDSAQKDEYCAKLFAQLVENSRVTTRDVVLKAIKDGHLPANTKADWIVDLLSAPITYRALLSKQPVNERGYVQFLVDAATSGAIKN
jgi:AcrR family transcriptional regulator